MIMCGEPNNKELYYYTSDDNIIYILHHHGYIPKYVHDGYVYFSEKSDICNLLKMSDIYEISSD